MSNTGGQFQTSTHHPSCSMDEGHKLNCDWSYEPWPVTPAFGVERRVGQFLCRKSVQIKILSSQRVEEEVVADSASNNNRFIH